MSCDEAQGLFLTCYTSWVVSFKKEEMIALGGVIIDFSPFCSLVDAGIEDLSSNPSADVDGVIARVEERFRLDLNDEQAERYFTGLINDCLAAIAPRVMEIFHSFSVARR